MGDFESAPSSKERVFGDFFHDLEKTTDRYAVVGQYVGAFPQWAAEFREEAALENVLVSSQPLPSAGDLELPDFRLIREIARGGMGIVYEAEQLSLKRRVAVKVRRGRLAPSAHDRFQIEQQVLAQLHQTHIVPIHTAGQAGPWQYFAMAYIEGAALHRVVRATRNSTLRFGLKTPTLAGLAGEVLSGSQERAAESFGAGHPAAKLKSTANDLRIDAAHRSALDAGDAAPSGEKPMQGLTLSHDYFRSVAAVIADAAEALQHAHDAHVLHRDVKPSNIMVDTSGQCWLIDFGLARLCNGQARVKAPAATKEESMSPPLTQGALGTPQYMAPEQYQEKTDVRSDVWGLGVTLYELLALSPAFDGSTIEAIHAKVVNEEPRPPQTLVRSVPPDLAAICRKAIQKNPELRYQSAADLAEDLRRWLCYEPTKARPARTLRRVSLWSRRNKGWAATLTLALATSILVVGGVIAFETQRAEAERQRANAESQRAAAAEEQERILRCSTLLLEAQHFLSSTSRRPGWSQLALSLVVEATKHGQHARELVRDQAAATFADLDVHKLKEHRFGGSSLAFDATGSRLLIGGLDANNGRRMEAAKIWDSEHDQILVTSSKGGSGPVAFGLDGTSFQVVEAKNSTALLIWDVAKQQAIREIGLPLGKGAGLAQGLDLCHAALSDDGALLAASAIALNQQETIDRGMVWVWDVASGKLLRQWPTKAVSLAIAGDHSFVAMGDDQGRLVVGAVATGEQLSLPAADRLAIHCLAFHRDFLRRENSKHGATNWLLGAGDAGGTVTIWDLAEKKVRNSCRGHSYEVSGVAFSPDGLLLASSSRDGVRLWEMATGRLLLQNVGGDAASSAAFSPDGQKLAVACRGGFGVATVTVLTLEFYRGIRVLRGLANQVAQVCFSPDGRLLAAVSHDWKVAMWDLTNGQMRYVVETPKGFLADNASLAFSADGRRFAFTSGRDAVLWDVTTGDKTWHKKLPPGAVDALVFHPTGRLLSLRVETADGKAGPFAGSHPKEHPRVCRIRDLESLQIIKEIKEFNWHVYGALAAGDGRSFVVEGLHVGPEGKRRTVKVLDSLTGQERWSNDIKRTEDHSMLLSDPQAKYLAYYTDDPRRGVLVEIDTGKFLEALNAFPHALGRDATLRLRMNRPDAGGGVSVLRSQGLKPLVTLNLGAAPSSAIRRFSPNGAMVAWGNTDGTVTVCDIEMIRRQLTRIDLGW